MSKTFQWFGLIVLVVLATSGVWQAAAQVEAKKERPKWEYATAGEGGAMHQLGEQGWELVAVSAQDTLYFKRLK